MGGLAGGGKSGGGSNSAPGFVDPFSLGALQTATANSEQMMHNRYRQLGLGVPAQGTQGGPGGTAAQAAASGQSLTYGSPGTPEKMDLGMMPSLTGGIPGMALATLGQMETNALSQSSGGGGGGKGGGGGLGGLGSLAKMGGK